MYICPTCGRFFRTEEHIQKHFLSCWKEQHPYHKSTPAPKGKDVVISEVEEGVLDFFSGLKR